MSRAVLISGGLDSVILLGEALQTTDRLFPLYIRCGLAWEETELVYLKRFLIALDRPTLAPLTILEQPVADLYGQHWSITRQAVPDADTQDEAVFLPGRNVLLLTKGLLWCHLRKVPALALGALGSNPFPDATPEFFQALEHVVNLSVGGSVRVELPFRHLHKTDVLLRGKDLPLEHTFSCINPKDGLHCGQCNKCHERRRGFEDAGMKDPTRYAAPLLTVGQLNDFLKNLPSLGDDAKAFAQDVKDIRSAFPPEGDPWD